MHFFAPVSQPRRKELPPCMWAGRVVSQLWAPHAALIQRVGRAVGGAGGGVGKDKAELHLTLCLLLDQMRLAKS